MIAILISLWCILLLPLHVPAEEIFTQQGLISATNEEGKYDSIFAATAITWIAKRGVDTNTLTLFGNRSIIGVSSPMTPTTSFRTNTLSELFIDMTVVYLENQGVLPFSRSQVIPRDFLPPPFNTNITFQNPLYPNAVISLNTLLQHTSSLTEAGFNAGAAQTPGPVMSISSFVENIMANGGTNGMWGTAQPGLASSYQYSRVNTALVTYILEKVLVNLDNPVNSLATFVENTFIAPMGLRGTFLVDTTGAAPVPSYPPNSVSLLSSHTVQDVTNDGMTIPTSVLIHAAYASDYMYYTTITDLAKLASELFLGGQYTNIGQMLRNDTITLISSSSSNSNSNSIPGLVSRSLGVYSYDPVKLCEATSLGDACQFSRDDVNLYGWIVGGEYNQVALLCTEEKCVAAEVSFPSSTTNTFSRLIELAIAPFVVEKTQLEGGKLYGLYVFIGVIATIIVVIVFSYLADYVIQPARAAAPLPVNKNALPMNTTSTQEVAGMMETEELNNTQGVASPVRRLDMYD